MNKQALIKGLNDDLNMEIAASLRYLLEASLMWGLGGHEAREVFQDEVADEIKHAVFLADKIVALGGTPEIKPELPAPITDPKKALQRELDYENKAIAGYIERCKQADECGEIGLRIELENLVAEQSHHAKEIERRMGE